MKRLGLVFSGAKTCFCFNGEDDRTIGASKLIGDDEEFCRFVQGLVEKYQPDMIRLVRAVIHPRYAKTYGRTCMAYGLLALSGNLEQIPFQSLRRLLLRTLGIDPATERTTDLSGVILKHVMPGLQDLEKSMAMAIALACIEDPSIE